jgi:ribonuclease VapC
VSSYVLDASALLALLNNEPGSARVKEIRFYLDALGLTIVNFDRALAYECGFLLPLTKAGGLSLGDRACLALAASLGVPALTCDRVWATLNLGVQVELLR